MKPSRDPQTPALAQSTCVGIWWVTRIPGSNFIDILADVPDDPKTEAIVMNLAKSAAAREEKPQPFIKAT